MSKVFIIEPLRRDLDITAASDFGEIQYVIEPGERRCSPFQHVEFSALILNRLQALNFKPDVDKICIVGTMLTIAVSLIAIAQAHSEFNILLFNSSMNEYVEKQIRKEK